jgi:hypothetical protein
MDGAADEPRTAASDIRLPTSEAAVETVCNQVLGLAEGIVLSVDHNQRESWLSWLTRLPHRIEERPGEQRPVSHATAHTPPTDCVMPSYSLDIEISGQDPRYVPAHDRRRPESHLALSRQAGGHWYGPVPQSVPRCRS